MVGPMGDPAAARAVPPFPRPFLRFVATRLLTTLAIQAYGVVAAWQIFELTNDPAMLGLLGLVQFVPMLLATPLSGLVADRFPRRTLALAGAAACLVGIGALAAFTYLGSRDVTGFFAIAVLLGVVRAFAGPALTAMLGELTTFEERPRAVALMASTFQFAIVSGPALGGLALAAFGPLVSYLGSCASLLAACALMLTVPKHTLPRGAHEKGAILGGLRFVAAHRTLLGAISLDLFAVLLGGAVALLPAVVKQTLHAGPTELGLLRASPAIGAVCVGVLLTRMPAVRNAGKAMLAAVVVFGVATIVFGLARSFPLAMGALVVAGASDMVSVYVRQSLVQLETPDAMRGRVSAVSMVFISASNELGELESGLLAATIGVREAIVFGGVASIVIALLWAFVFPELRRLDRLGGPHPT